MDRQTVYPGAIPLETDLLNTNKNTMVAIGKLAAIILGTGTLLNGFATAATSPASLQVNVGAGEIYASAAIDTTAYSSLAADTAHTIIKQGISLDSVTLNCPAPVTSGQSINYLIQVAYQDTDAGSVILPYYNSGNPGQAFSGPNNTGQAQYTQRKGAAVIQVKAGVSAATGSQVTPAPDSGFAGAYVVTVAFGQTTITAGNIAAYAGAPFFSGFAQLSGATFTGPVSVPNATQTQHALPLGQAVGRLLNVRKFDTAGTYTYTPTPGTTAIFIRLQAGGGGAGATATCGTGFNSVTAGGAAGGYLEDFIASGFAGTALVIGAAGPGGSTPGAPGANGGTSSFGTRVCTGGFGSAGGNAGNTFPVIIPGNGGGQASGSNLLNSVGAQGNPGLVMSLTAALSGSGGTSQFCGGGFSTGGTSSGNSSRYGAGGGGASTQAGASGASGGTGGAGYAEIWEYGSI